MSTKAVIRFLQDIADDSPLKERVRPVSDVQAIIQMAQLSGYEFDDQDWSAGIQEVKQRRDKEISDFQKAGCPFIWPEEVVGMASLSSSLLE